MSDIQLVGVDTDGSTIYRDSYAELVEKYNTGEAPDAEEVAELRRAGWDGTTRPWEIPDEPENR